MSTKKNNSFKKKNYYMNLAHEQAERSLGRTGTNPPVGCVIVNENGEICSSGRTGINGIPHAEFSTIKNTKKRLLNTSLFVTLEPCTHYGKTEPCVKQITKKKIKKVYYSIPDVDNRTANKSKKILRKKKNNS